MESKSMRECLEEILAILDGGGGDVPSIREFVEQEMRKLPVKGLHADSAEVYARGFENGYSLGKFAGISEESDPRSIEGLLVGLGKD